MAVETSIVVQFSDGSSGEDTTVVVELDPTDVNNQDSNGNLKSSFLMSDTPSFIVHFDESKWTVNTPESSSGTITSLTLEDDPGVTLEKDIEISFANNEDEASLGFFEPSLVGDFTWWGNSCTYTISGSKAINPSGSFPCVGKGKFNVLYPKRYRITPPTGVTLAPGEEYKIVVLVTLTAA